MAGGLNGIPETMWQQILVAALVAGATVYSAWTLMPQAWRRALARQLLRLPALARVGALRAAAAGRSGCAGGCDGCGPAPAPGDAKVVHWQRRPGR